MKWSKFDGFMLIGVLGAVLVRIGSTSLLEIWPILKPITLAILGLLLLIWIICIVYRVVVSRVTAGRYAVEAFILDAENRLLLYKHPHHNKHLPPGGRVNGSEFPDEAVGKRLAERLGLSEGEYAFHRVFHPKLDGAPVHLGDVERVPAPYMVQKERHEQRGKVRFHYDFLYVLQLGPGRHRFEDRGYLPVSFADLPGLRDLVNRGDTFPDVLATYEEIIATIQLARQP